MRKFFILVISFLIMIAGPLASYFVGGAVAALWPSWWALILIFPVGVLLGYLSGYLGGSFYREMTR